MPTFLSSESDAKETHARKPSKQMPRVNVRTFLIDCDGLEIARSDGEEEEGEMPSSVVSTFPAGSRNSGARSFSLLAGIFLSLFLSSFQREKERERMMREMWQTTR